LEDWPCRSCTANKLRCDKNKSGCTTCGERETTCVYDRDKRPLRIGNRGIKHTACVTCQRRRRKCTVVFNSVACTACSGRPTTCSFHPDYKSGDIHGRLHSRIPGAGKRVLPSGLTPARSEVPPDNVTTNVRNETGTSAHPAPKGADTIAQTMRVELQTTTEDQNPWECDTTQMGEWRNPVEGVDDDELFEESV
jgi:hypothetical protein